MKRIDSTKSIAPFSFMHKHSTANKIMECNTTSLTNTSNNNRLVKVHTPSLLEHISIGSYAHSSRNDGNVICKIINVIEKAQQIETEIEQNEKEQVICQVHKNAAECAVINTQLISSLRQ